MPDFTIDSRSLKFLRCGLGGLILWDLLDRSQALSAHYSNAGVMAVDGPVPLSTIFTYWSIHHLAPSPLGQAVFMLLHAALALWLISGVRPRLATAAVFVMTVSLHHRNEAVLYGADDVLRLTLLWSIFLQPRTGREEPCTLNSPATIIYLAQVAVIFFAAGLHKIFDPAWLRGEGIVKGVAAAPGYWADLVLNNSYLFILPSFALIALQIFGALLLFVVRARLAVTLAFMAVHLGMAATMDLSMFPFTVIVALIPFLPARVWDKIHSLRALPPPRFARGPAVVAALVAGVLIPLGGEWADERPRESVWRSIYVATGLRQHWRLFTPVPWSAEWSAFLARTKDGTLYDLAHRREFTGWEVPSLRFWARQRWAPLTKQMTANPDIAVRLAQMICQSGPFTSVHFHRLSRGLGRADRVPAAVGPAFDYECSDSGRF